MSKSTTQTEGGRPSTWRKIRQNKIVDTFADVFDWYPAHYSPTERSLVKKLDRTMLLFACFSFWVKYLDQANLTNAYVSGMEGDIGMTGNDLNYAVMAWTAAYVVGQVPGLLLQTRPKVAAYLLPCLELIWGVLTFAQSRVTAPWHVYLLRSLLGFFEAPSFGATHFLLSSWYTKEEIFKRAGTWFTCNALGQMVSGYLQTAALNNPHLFGNMAPWRALFVLDGIITLPIAFLGLAFFPGIPASKKPWYMKKEEHDLAATRLGPEQRTEAEPISFKTFKRTLSMPLWWICVTIYIFLIQSAYWTGYMALWLKSEPTKFSVQDRNTYPTPIYVITALASWLGTSLAARISVIKIFSVAQVAMTISLIILIIWNVPSWLKFAAFYLSGLSGLTSPVLYSWLNNSLRSDPEARALIIGSMMAIGYSTQIWIPLFTFPTVEAPSYPKGYPASLAFLLAMWLLFTYGVTYRRKLAARNSDLEALPGKEGSIDESDFLASVNSDEKADRPVVGNVLLAEKPLAA